MEKRQQEPYKLYTIPDLLHLKDSPDRWIVRDMIPKSGRTIVYGDGGSFKSTIVFDLAIAIASGGKLCEYFPVHTYGPVIMISTEGSIYDNKDRVLFHLRARNLHPEIVQFYYGQQRMRLDKAVGIALLEQMIHKINPTLIVLDPFVSFFSGNENSAEDVNDFCAGLDELIRKYNVSVLVIHHANKSGGVRGSTVLFGWADSILKFTTEKNVQLPGVGDHPVHVLTVTGEKQRNGREGQLFSAVPFIDESLGMTTFGIYDDQNFTGVILAHMKHAILDKLRVTGPMTKKDLCTGMGLHNNRVAQVLSWLTVYGLVNQEGTVARGGRKYKAYQATAAGCRVDMVRAILSVERAETEHLTEV